MEQQDLFAVTYSPRERERRAAEVLEFHQPARARTESTRQWSAAMIRFELDSGFERAQRDWDRSQARKGAWDRVFDLLGVERGAWLDKWGRDSYDFLEQEIDLARYVDRMAA